MNTYKDLNGTDIEIGDLIVYATRDGNTSSQHTATVTELREGGSIRVDHISGTRNFEGSKKSRIVWNLGNVVAITSFKS